MIRKLRNVVTAVLLVAGGAYGCSKDVTFTDDPSCKAEFSTDTLSFDTVFTSIGSATDCFKIYNRHDSGIRLDVSLAGGTDSPFRINVDGQSGTVISGVEVLPEDSAYCFVSVSIDPHDSDNPILVTDSIRFAQKNGSVQYVTLMAYGQDVIILRNERITESRVLTSDRPYLIYDTLLVDKNAVLRIEAGTRMYFHDKALVKVTGKIQASGTYDDRIVMRGDRLDNLLQDVPYDLLAGRWGGILLDSCSFGNQFVGCDIHGGTWGIVADTANLILEKLLINSSIIHNVSTDGLQLNYCRGRIYNSQITNAGGHCVNLLGGDNVFQFCTIADFYPWSKKLSAVEIRNKADSTILPIANAEFSYCIITGSSSDELSGLVVDSISGRRPEEISNYSFSHSLILTPDTLNRHMHDNVWDKESNAVHGAGNFRHISSEDYRYDFHLDSLSLARFMAVSSGPFMYDIDGVERPDSLADVGCYQYVAK